MTFDRRLLPVVEVASMLVTLTVVLGFSRLLEAPHFARLALAALLSHGLAIAVRRLGLGLIAGGTLSVAGALVFITYLYYGDTTSAGLIPSGGTLDALRVDINTSWDQFGTVVAPAAPEVGFMVASSIAVWVAAYLLDWAAFRLGSRIEAIIPAAAIFGFQTFVGGDVDRIRTAALFGAAVLFFVLSHRTADGDIDGSWLADLGDKGRIALLRGGAFAGLAALLIGVIVGPALPGAGDEGVVDFDNSGSGDGTRVALNPLVDIRTQLVDLPDTLAFTVASTQPHYWRVTALDVFTGDQWTARTKFDDAKGDLPSDVPPNIPGTEIESEFRIANLASDWLPAVYEPSRVESEDLKISYSPSTGSLLRGSDRELRPGDTYTVVSDLPDIQRAQVETASSAIPTDVAERYLQLPDGFSAAVTNEARRVVDDAGATTRYEQALALQKHFTDNFAYDLEVAKGHDNARLEEFLFEFQRGYCEQFSGTFAAMARSIGIPARVAVGFTVGDYNPTTDRYEVRGTHAHAWPEVWFENVGWVRFEPTPGRGAPGDEAITETEPQEIEESPSPTVTTPVPQTVPEAQRAPLPDENAAPQPVAVAAPTWWRSLVTPILIGVFSIALLAALVYALWATKRRLRHARVAGGGANRERIGHAWVDALDGLSLLDVATRPHETPSEFATRGGGSIDEITRGELQELADLATKARYSPVDPTDAEAVRAQHLSDTMRAAAVGRVGTLRRLAWELDPRPLWRDLVVSQRQSVVESDTPLDSGPTPDEDLVEV